MASNESSVRSRGVISGKPKAVVRPIDPSIARQFVIAHHPTGKGMSSSMGMCFGLTVRSKVYGVATWGYNIGSGSSAKYLFGEHSTAIDYLDNKRLIIIKNPAEMQPSSFLSIVCKILFQHRPSLKYLIAYAAGLHGFRGTIYQAANFLYGGPDKMDLWWIPGYGFMSQRSVADVFKGKDAWRHIKDVHPNIRRVHATRFRYIRFRDKQTQNELMKHARFTIRPGTEVPKQEDIYFLAYDDDIKKATKVQAITVRNQPFVPYMLRKTKTFRGRAYEP